MKEIWKDIEGYEGLYQISNLGRVKSFNYRNKNITKLVKPQIVSGYYMICLHKNKNIKHYSIHRLIAQAFIPNPDKLPCVNHKDENKLNNNISNLEWCTHSYNVNYGTRIERANETCKNNKQFNSYKSIVQKDIKGNIIRIWKSSKEIVDVLGYNRGFIMSCCEKRKHYLTAYGYIWEYLLED